MRPTSQVNVKPLIPAGLFELTRVEFLENKRARNFCCHIGDIKKRYSIFAQVRIWKLNNLSQDSLPSSPSVMPRSLTIPAEAAFPILERSRYAERKTIVMTGAIHKSSFRSSFFCATGSMYSSGVEVDSLWVSCSISKSGSAFSAGKVDMVEAECMFMRECVMWCESVSRKGSGEAVGFMDFTGAATTRGGGF